MLRNEINKKKQLILNKMAKEELYKPKMENKIEMEWEEFIELMKQTTENLNKMTKTQAYMRWQFGEIEELNELIEAMNDATNSWIRSNC